ncbi:MAG: hypothetical protein ACR2LM_06065 [Pyrinomonadaceae bacterium]
MSSIRNFEQLILVKHLFQDARDLTGRGDRLSLTKAIILLDLSIEQSLKSILLNLNPNFIIPRGRQDIKWRDLWQNASSAVQNIKGVALSEQNESSRLHELRNLVQHHGTEPPSSEVRRHVVSTNRMLTDAFRDAFDLDFDNLRPWDFVENDDLRRLLNECEEFLRNGNPVVCVIGCKIARTLIIEAIRKYTTKERFDFPPMFSSRAGQDAYAVKEFADFIIKLSEYTSKRIRRLETEVLLVGMGLPIIDTRRFMQLRGSTSESTMADGHLEVNINNPDTNKEAETANAIFMLDYLYRLIRSAEENHPGVLSEIKVQMPLSEQGIAKYTDWFK